MRTLLVLLSIFCAYSCAFEPMKVQKYANLEQCRLDSIITHYHKAQENQHNKLALDEMFEQYHEELKAFFDENPEVKDWEAVLQGLKSSDTNLNGETYKRITFDLININRQESIPKTTFNAAYWVKIDSLQTDSVYQKLKSIGNIQKVKFSGTILRKEDGSVLTVYKSLGTSHLMTYPSFNILITDISKQQ